MLVLPGSRGRDAFLRRLRAPVSCHRLIGYWSGSSCPPTGAKSPAKRNYIDRLVMSVISIQRGFSLPVATLTSAARRLSGARQNKTIGLPMVFILAVAFVTAFGLAGRSLPQGGLRPG